MIVFGRSLGGAVAIELCASIAEYGPKYITTPLKDLPPPPSSSLPHPPPRKRRGEGEEEEERKEEEGERELVEGKGEGEEEGRKPACLIIENTFTSILDMIDEVFPLLRFVVF